MKRFLQPGGYVSKRFGKLAGKLVYHCVLEGYVRALSELWGLDAQLGYVDEDSGGTLLRLAAREGHPDAVKFLAEVAEVAKISPAVKTGEGRTALSLAATRGHLGIVQLLAPLGRAPTRRGTRPCGMLRRRATWMSSPTS